MLGKGLQTVLHIAVTVLTEEHCPCETANSSTAISPAPVCPTEASSIIYPPAPPGIVIVRGTVISASCHPRFELAWLLPKSMYNMGH